MKGHAMSFKPEVIADGSGKFCGSSVRFATKHEAEIYVTDLMGRWTAVRDTRVVESEDPVTHAIVDGELRRVQTAEEKSDAPAISE